MAASRSTTISVAKPLSCWSLVTSLSSGSVRSLPISFGTHSAPTHPGIGIHQRVLKLRAAHARTDLNILHRLHVGFQTRRCRPDHGLQAAQSPQGADGRCRRGTRVMLIRPDIRRGVYRTGAHQRRHAGNSWILLNNGRRLQLQHRSWPGMEIFCAASVVTTMAPVSCCGKNPLGMTMYRNIVPASVPAAISRTMPLCRSEKDQRAPVERQPARKQRIHAARAGPAVLPAQQPRAHHRRQRQ